MDFERNKSVICFFPVKESNIFQSAQQGNARGSTYNTDPNISHKTGDTFLLTVPERQSKEREKILLNVTNIGTQTKILFLSKISL